MLSICLFSTLLQIWKTYRQRKESLIFFPNTPTHCRAEKDIFGGKNLKTVFHKQLSLQKSKTTQTCPFYGQCCSISISLAGSAFLYIQPRNHSEEALVPVYGAEGGRQKIEGKDEENNLKTNFLLLEGPRTEESTGLWKYMCGNGSSGCWCISKCVIENCDFWYKAEWLFDEQLLRDHL